MNDQEHHGTNSEVAFGEASSPMVLASTGQRLRTMFLDTFFYFILFFVFGLVMGLVGLGDLIEGNLLGAIMFLIYYIPQEAFSGRTLGKLITGTKAVSEDGTELTFGQVLGRTLCRFIPFEAFSFLGGNGRPRGWHDKIPKTKVISVRLDRVQSMRPTPKKEPITLKKCVITVVFILSIPALYTIWTLTGGDTRGQWVLVTHVTDGDTVGVGRGWRYKKVRLIGVDTPETVHPEKPVEFYGPEALEFTEKSLTRQWVRLEFEPGDQIDVYGRLLAYIFLEDGTLFNRDIVRRGYARAYTRFPFRYQEEFRLAEIEARNIGRGLWVRQKREATSAHPLEGKIIGNRRSKVFHVPGQANYGRVSEESRVYFDTEEEAARAGYRRAKR